MDFFSSFHDKTDLETKPFLVYFIIDPVVVLMNRPIKIIKHHKNVESFRLWQHRIASHPGSRLSLMLVNYYGLTQSLWRRFSLKPDQKHFVTRDAINLSNVVHYVLTKVLGCSKISSLCLGVVISALSTSLLFFFFYHSSHSSSALWKWRWVTALLLHPELCFYLFLLWTEKETTKKQWS